YQWKAVESDISDINPIEISPRVLPTDMRVINDFSRVYELEGRPRLYGNSHRYYMRTSGALEAIYPHGVYKAAGKGLARAEVPPGTIYSIGGYLSDIVGQPAKEVKKVPSNFIDRSAGHQPP